MTTKNPAPLIIIIALVAALLLLDQLAHAGEPWKVYYRNGTTFCCTFSSLADANDFVRRMAGDGETYVIYHSPRL